MDCIIRKAAESDIVPMAELDKLCFAVPWSRESFNQEIINNDLACYLVADYNGMIIAYAGLWRIFEEGHITNVAVHPDYREKGLGLHIVSELIRISEEEGLKRFTLEVRASNTPAISLYSKLGFRPAGFRKNYYEDNNEDAMIMWL